MDNKRRASFIAALRARAPQCTAQLLNKVRDRLKQGPRGTRAASLELDALSKFLSPLRDAQCTVFGSAPNPVLEPSAAGKIICCNAAAITLQTSFGIAPDFSIINGNLFLPSAGASVVNAQRAFGELRELGAAVFCYRSDEDRGRFSATMTDKCSATLFFPRAYRGHLIEQLLGARIFNFPNRPNISMGAFATGLAFYAGAKSVQLVGISLNQKGHSYSKSGSRRSHVSSDAAFFSLLSCLGYDLSSSDPILSVLCRGRVE